MKIIPDYNQSPCKYLIIFAYSIATIINVSVLKIAYFFAHILIKAVGIKINNHIATSKSRIN